MFELAMIINLMDRAGKLILFLDLIKVDWLRLIQV